MWRVCTAPTRQRCLLCQSGQIASSILRAKEYIMLTVKSVWRVGSSVGGGNHVHVRPFKSLITTSFSYLLRYHSHHTGNVCDSTNHGSLDHVTLAEFITTSLVDHRVLFCSSCYYHSGSNTYNRPVFLIPSLISLFFFKKSIFLCTSKQSTSVCALWYVTANSPVNKALSH